MQFLQYYTLLHVKITLLFTQEKTVKYAKEKVVGRMVVEIHLLSILRDKLAKIIYATQLSNYPLFKGHASLAYLKIGIDFLCGSSSAHASEYISDI